MGFKREFAGLLRAEAKQVPRGRAWYLHRFAMSDLGIRLAPFLVEGMPPAGLEPATRCLEGASKYCGLLPLNDHVTADERVDSVMLLVTDGLTFVRRR